MPWKPSQPATMSHTSSARRAVGGAVGDPGRRREQVVQRHVGHLEHGRGAGRDPGRDQVLDDLLLPVHGDRAAGQRRGSRSGGRRRRSAARCRGAPGPRGRAARATPAARRSSTVGCSSTPARTRFSTYSRLRDSSTTESMPASVQQVGEQQAGRTGADDADLGAHPGLHGVVATGTLGHAATARVVPRGKDPVWSAGVPARRLDQLRRPADAGRRSAPADCRDCLLYEGTGRPARVQSRPRRGDGRPGGRRRAGGAGAADAVVVLHPGVRRHAAGQPEEPAGLDGRQRRALRQAGGLDQRRGRRPGRRGRRDAGRSCSGTSRRTSSRRAGYGCRCSATRSGRTARWPTPPCGPDWPRSHRPSWTIWPAGS